MNNPTLAIESIVDGEKKLGGLTIYPITIGRYALLELVESPFVTKGQDFNVYNLVPSFYVMCSPKENLRGYTRKNVENLIEKAMEWADDLDTDIVPQLIDEIAYTLGLLKKISPNNSESQDTSKKDIAQTVG